MKKYPLQLSYIAKSAIWGGTRLRTAWGKQGETDPVAETWELSVRPKEMAVIQNGEAKGMTLADYLRACGGDCVSPDYSLDDRFPLLVKLIDAGDRLSVQVHPDDDYAGRVEGDSGKTEMWYIVEAEEGATIVYGLKEGVTKEEFIRAVGEKRTETVLLTRPVKAGECYFIPAGLVHAIGRGILIAEIQQNSDLTYRVYDYDRIGTDGKPRELHVQKAIETVHPYTEAEIDEIRYAKGRSEERLVNSQYFSVSRKEICGRVAMKQGRESFTSLLCIAGEGMLLTADGERYPIRRGDSYWIPAGMEDYTAEGTLTLICSQL